MQDPQYFPIARPPKQSAEIRKFPPQSLIVSQNSGKLRKIPRGAADLRKSTHREISAGRRILRIPRINQSAGLRNSAGFMEAGNTADFVFWPQRVRVERGREAVVAGRRKGLSSRCCRWMGYRCGRRTEVGKADLRKIATPTTPIPTPSHRF